ncbi:MAG: glycosyltransferase, partial [Acidaminococcaceae bacterium]
MSKLAVIVLTKNEEKNIADVIANAKGCADEVVIVDSGSTDGTVT